MFKYCPNCASVRIAWRAGKFWSCPDCGLEYYHNTAAACGALVETAGGLLLLRRAKEPAAGKLDLPGGFADPGEGIVEALRRECAEEFGWEPPESCISFLTSYSNVYPYKKFIYNTCDSFFVIHAPPDFGVHSLRLQPDEVSEAVFVPPACLNFDDIAFESAKNALRYYCAQRVLG